MDKVTVEVQITGRIAGVDIDDVQKLKAMAPEDIVGRLFHVGEGITSKVSEIIPENIPLESKAIPKKRKP
jgi:hypothetical protein